MDSCLLISGIMSYSYSYLTTGTGIQYLVITDGDWLRKTVAHNLFGGMISLAILERRHYFIGC